MANGNLKQIDLDLLDHIFEMGGGYVLDFSNKTFAEFFHYELGIEINNVKYCDTGDSKAKRLRSLLRQSDKATILRILNALWEYREIKRRRAGIAEEKSAYLVDYFSMIERLGGKSQHQNPIDKKSPSGEKIQNDVAVELLEKLMALSRLGAHQRGFAFEKFLKNLFDANEMAGRASFRLVGEQIDGSFEMSGETYLLEAKWTNQPIGAADLRAFNAKVQDKATWSRGLFISDAGFTEDGLVAFGKGKSVICMDGLDLSEMLMQKLSLQTVLSKKVRRAAETGRPFVRLRELL